MFTVSHRHLRLQWLCSGVVAVGIASTFAAEPTPGRTSNLRELTTDRPDTTESPFTVDPGHVQLEMDVVSYTRNRLDGLRTTEWVWAPFNLRYGVTPAIEVGVFLVPHQEVTEQPRGGARTKFSGVGDTTVRMKMNFWGNDGGPTAFGVIADLKAPTAAEGLGNDRTEAALTFPFAYELGAGWEGAAMTSVTHAHTEKGRRAVWTNTITFARQIGPNLGGFIELTSVAGEGSHSATFNCGLTRSIGREFQLDCGINMGISRTAPDLALFAGLSRKY